MKNLKYMMISLLAMLCCSAVSAQTWNFSDGVSSTDQTNLNADTKGWTYDSKNQRWGCNTVLSSEPLMANGAELEFTKGLKVKTTSKDQIRVDNKKHSLTVNNSGATITIPNLTVGKYVTIECQSSSSSTLRNIMATNLTTTSGFASSTSKTTNVGVVTATGDVVISTTGGMYIYSIVVTDASGSSTGGGGTSTTTTVNHSTVLNTAKNQAVITTADNVALYYNTENLSKISIDNTNNYVAVTPNGEAWVDTIKGTAENLSFMKAVVPENNGTYIKGVNKVEFLDAKGWNESAYVKFSPYTNATAYAVYIKGGQYASYTKIDKMLVRNYGTYCRADVPGLKAGTYSMKVVPVIDNAEFTNGANEANNLIVNNFDRSGFAHKNYSGVGAYKDDGTLKDEAQVLYVTKDNFNTVTMDLATNSKGTKTTYTGLGQIFYGKQKGYDTTPIDVRIIGEIKVSDATASTQLLSDQAGLLLKGDDANAVMNVTVEGVGDDATFYGFGFGIVNGESIEVRNLGIMNQGSSNDCSELKGPQHVWIHNMDYFYGQKGDGDHVKGDGSLDSKDDCTYVTFSYNHYWDTGKSNLCGMKSEVTSNLLCYHHNWFDHSDSRHPRVRTSTVHVWNNYYDGVSKYGIGATSGCSIFSEGNYFRDAHDPMLISLQGTDAKGEGTFSGENGGIIKSYGNIYAEKGTSSNYTPITQNESATSFDCYEVSSRNDVVPNSVVTKVGGTSYNNFDTNSSLMYTYTPDKAIDVPAKVTGFYGAGRINHGDIQYTFNNSTDDADYSRMAGLDKLISGYASSFVGIIGY